MNGKRSMNQSILQMLVTHPQPGDLQAETVAHCVEACMICAATCTSCADSCLAEEMVKELVHCVRINLDCADICAATGRVLARRTQPEWQLLYLQLEACQAACRTCAAVCLQHAEMHEHCRVCAEACQQCEQACDALRMSFPV